MAKHHLSWFLSILVLVIFSTSPVELGCPRLIGPKAAIVRVCQDLSERGLDKIPGDIQSNVTHLNLIENSIKNLTSGAFKGLDYLVQLDLRDNSISEIQEGAFEGIPSKIESLVLKENKLKKLEARMWTGLKEIVYLDIAKNELTTISHNCFGRDLRVINLYLGYNKIHYFDADTLKPMLNGLEFLSLYRNQLDWVPCLQHDNDNQIAEEPGSQKRKVLEMEFWRNPLRCQPCFCWAPVHETFDCASPWGQSESNKKPDHVCRDIASVQYTTHGNIQCCMVIEAEPNATCLSNPAAFEHKEKNTKSIESKTQTPRSKTKPEIYFTKKPPMSRCMLIGNEAMRQRGMEERHAALNKESINTETNNTSSMSNTSQNGQQILTNVGSQDTFTTVVIIYNILLTF